MYLYTLNLLKKIFLYISTLVFKERTGMNYAYYLPRELLSVYDDNNNKHCYLFTVLKTKRFPITPTNNNDYTRLQARKLRRRSNNNNNNGAMTSIYNEDLWTSVVTRNRVRGILVYILCSYNLIILYIYI